MVLKETQKTKIRTMFLAWSFLPFLSFGNDLDGAGGQGAIFVVLLLSLVFFSSWFVLIFFKKLYKASPKFFYYFSISLILAGFSYGAERYIQQESDYGKNGIWIPRESLVMGESDEKVEDIPAQRGSQEINRQDIFSILGVELSEKDNPRGALKIQEGRIKIKTGRINSRMIEDDTITDKDIDNGINLHVKQLITKEGIEIGGLATFGGGANILGNLDMNSHLILNIGSSGTDFTSGGGLNLAGDLNVGSGSFEVVSENGNITTSGNLYSQGTDINYFIGNVGIGTTMPDNPLVVSLPVASDSSFLKLTSATASSFNTYFGTTAPNQYSWMTNLKSDGSTWTADDATRGGWRIAEVANTSDSNSSVTFDYFNIGSSGTPSTLFKFTGSGYLGIGTTSPGSFLHVETNNGSTSIGAAAAANQGITVINSNNTTGKPIGIQFGGYSGYAFGGLYGIATSLSGSTIGDLVFASRTNTSDATFSEKMRILASGNVGIGTTSPNVKLEVSGVIRQSADAYQPSLGADAGRNRLSGYSSGTNLRVLATDNNYAYFGARGLSIGNNYAATAPTAEGMIVEGNVGIGTTSPGAKLEVAGDIKTIGGGYQLVIGNASGDFWSSIKNTGASGDGNLIFRPGGQDTVTMLKNGNVGIGTTAPTFTVGSGLHISNSSQANLRLEDDGDYIDFANQAGDLYLINRKSTGDIKFRVNSSTEAMTIIESGNVGIGTTSPNGRLTIVGSDVAADGKTWTASSVATSGGMFDSYQESTGSYGYQRYLDIVSVQDSDGTNGGGVIRFLTNPANSDTASERMRITKAGNIGIGTTSPRGKLDVYNNGDSNIFLGNADATGRLKIGWDNSNLRSFMTSWSSGGYYPFYIDASQIWLNPNTGGNVGIGTTTPSGKLQVAGNLLLSDGGELRFQNAGYNYITTKLTSDTIQVGGQEGTGTSIARVKLKADITEITGNVGIGTTSPGAKLEIGDATKDYQLLLHSGSSDYSYEIGRQLSVGETVGFLRFYGRQSGYGGFTFSNVDYGNLMTIKANGNVGIGATAPTLGKLQLGQSTDTVNSGLVITDTAVNDAIYIWNDGTRARIDSSSDGSGIISFNGIGTGNVGIGTTTPGELLDLSSTGQLGFGVGNAGASYDDISNAKINIFSDLTVTTDVLDVGNDARAAGLRFYNDGGGLRLSLTTRDIYTVTERLTINQNGNVGIGTTAPGELLDVAGNIEITSGSYMFKGAAWGSYNAFSGTAASFGTNGAGYYVKSGGALQFVTSVSTTPTDTMILSGGNVGIGTTAPGNLLEIYGNSDSERGMIIDNQGTGDSIVRFRVGGLTKMIMGIDNDDADKFKLSPSNFGTNDRLVIDSGGNVGIGTTSPRGKLDIYANSTDNDAKITYGYANPLNVLLTRRLNYGDMLIGRNLGGVAAADTYKTIYTFTTTGYSGLEFRYGGDINFYAAYGATTADATVTPSARMMIQGSSGNVGIGTTSPTTKLEIIGNGLINYGSVASDVASFSIRNSYETSTPTLVLQAVARSGTNVFGEVGAGGSSDRDNVIGATSGTFKIGNYSNNTLMFYTNSLSRMTILGGGNVGIGTTAPTKLLHLYNTTEATAWNQSTTGFSSFRNTNTSGDMYFAIDNSTASGFSTGNYTRAIWSTGAYPLVIATNATERMRIDSGGNVGIGTTSPQTTFDVRSASFPGARFVRTSAGASSAIDLIEGNGGYTRLVTEGGTNNFSIRPGGTATAMFNSNGGLSLGSYISDTPPSNGMIVSGNVGIGTTSPGTKLDVLNGTIRATDGTRTLLMYQYNSNNYLMSAGGSLFISSGGSDIYFGHEGGNVAIGKQTSPGAKLEIQSDSTSTTLTGGNKVLQLLNAQASNTDNYHVALAFRLENGVANKNGYINFINDATNGLGDFSFVTTQSGSSYERMRIKGSGNVGIGTTTPGFVAGANKYLSISTATGSAGISALELQGTEAGSGGAVNRLSFVSNYSGTTKEAARIEQRTDGSYSGAGVLAFYTRKMPADTLSEWMRIDESGNVGIGTTSPSTKLHIYDGSSRADIRLDRNTSSNWSELGALGFYGKDDASNSTGYSQLTGYTVSTSNPSEIGGIKIETIDAGTLNYRFIIEGSNMGINTGTIKQASSSYANLHIGGSANFGYHKTSRNIGLSDNGYIGSDTNWKYKGTNSAALMTLLNGDWYVATVGSGTADNTITWTERLYVTNAGNVGIGTTTPGSLLNVAGSYHLGQETSNSWGLWSLSETATDQFGVGQYTGGAANHFYLASNQGTNRQAFVAGDNTGTQTAFGFSTSNDSGSTWNPRLVINQTGNVGIGTTAPTSMLEILSSGTAPFRIVRNTNDTGDPSMTLRKSRGTDTAAADNDTAGTISFQFLNDAATKEWVTAGKTEVIADDITDGTEDGHMAWYTVSAGTLAERMRLTSDGNLGIGSVSPGRKLFVSGDAGGTTGWYNDSDLRLKKNITTLEDSLSKVLSLRPVNFEWKDDSRPDGNHIGFIAQEVLEIVPEVVSKGGTYYGVDYSSLAPLLVGAVQTQQIQIAGISDNQSLLSSEFTSSVMSQDEILKQVQDDLGNLEDELDYQISEIESKLSLKASQTDLDSAKLRIEYLESLLGIGTAETGNIEILGNVKVGDILAREIEVDDILARGIAFRKDARVTGEESILEGETKVEVETASIKENSRVFLTPKTPVDFALSVSKITPGESFTVEIKSPAGAEIPFDFLIVDEE